MKSAWGRLALLCLAVMAAAVAVGGGSAGNREDVEFSFNAVPGPGRVTYGENIAYRATFQNKGSSTFTQVAFRMRYPYIDSGTEPPLFKEAAKPQRHTCPTEPTTVTLASGYQEWVCTFGQLKPLTAAKVVSVVWQAPEPNAPLSVNANCPTPLAEAAGALGCLATNGRWTIKEGINDQSDPNDAYPPGGAVVRATLLATGDASQEVKEAGGYELPAACTNPLGVGSLRTKQTVSLANPVSTTICLPDFDPDPNPDDDQPATDPGLASTIVEELLDDTNPAGHPLLGRSRICIADRGANCGAENTYTPFAFLEEPMRVVFRISSEALVQLYRGDRTNTTTITQVFHNGVPLPLCPSAEPQGCYTSIKENKKDKVWVIEAQAPGNGLWGW